MKRFLFVTAALLSMSVSFCFGQSKEDIKASIDRCAKLEKLCSKQPKQTGVADVDTYVQGVYNAAISSAASSALLQNLYYRQIGETKDGVTDVSIKKPTVEELIALSLKSATKPFNVLLACTRPFITELSYKLRQKRPLLPTTPPYPIMRLETIRSIIPISCRRHPKSVWNTSA